MFAQAHAGGDTNATAHDQSQAAAAKRNCLASSLSFVVHQEIPAFLITNVKPRSCQTNQIMFSIQRLMPAATSRGVGTTIDCVCTLVRRARAQREHQRVGESAVLRCIIMWVPFWRTCTNPFSVRSLQTPLPLKTFSLPNGYLETCYENFFMKPFTDFLT